LLSLVVVVVEREAPVVVLAVVVPVVIAVRFRVSRQVVVLQPKHL